ALVIAPLPLLLRRRPVLRSRRRTRSRDRPLRRRPVTRRYRLNGWPATVRGAIVIRRTVIIRRTLITGPRHGPIARRARPYRLNRRSAIIGWPVVVRWRPITRRPAIHRAIVSRPVPGTIDWPGWPVIRRTVSPVAAKPGAIVIHHRTRPIGVARRAIPTTPAAPPAAVVIDPPSPPVPSPAAPAPGLAHEQRRDPDRNAERDQSRARTAGIHHRGVILRQVHHLRISRLNYVDGLPAILLDVHHLLGRRAQCARCVSLCAQSLNRRRDLSLVRQHRSPNGRIVVDIFRHHLDHLGKTHQG